MQCFVKNKNIPKGIRQDGLVWFTYPREACRSRFAHTTQRVLEHGAEKHWCHQTLGMTDSQPRDGPTPGSQYWDTKKE